VKTNELRGGRMRELSFLTLERFPFAPALPPSVILEQITLADLRHEMEETDHASV
jgi:hypothetical protein